MKAPIMAVAAIAALTGGAVAEVRYNRNLERAVLGIVKQRIGDIRGPLAFDAMVIQPDLSTAWRPVPVSPSVRTIDGAPRQLDPWLMPATPVSHIATR